MHVLARTDLATEARAGAAAAPLLPLRRHRRAAGAVGAGRLRCASVARGSTSALRNSAGSLPKLRGAPSRRAPRSPSSAVQRLDASAQRTAPSRSSLEVRFHRRALDGRPWSAAQRALGRGRRHVTRGDLDDPCSEKRPSARDDTSGVGPHRGQHRRVREAAEQTLTRIVGSLSSLGIEARMHARPSSARPDRAAGRARSRNPDQPPRAQQRAASGERATRRSLLRASSSMAFFWTSSSRAPRPGRWWCRSAARACPATAGRAPRTRRRTPRSAPHGRRG